MGKNLEKTASVLDQMLDSTNREQKARPGYTANGVKIGRPKKNNREITKTSQQGLKEGDTRATLIIKEDKLRKLKALSLVEGKPFKDIVDDMATAYLKDKDIPDAILKIIEKQEENRNK